MPESKSSSSSSSSRFIERITQTPLMRYVSRCAANRQVFNADMRLSMLSVGSRRNSGNEYADDRTRDGQRSTTKTCCDVVVARSADDSWLIATAALTAIYVRCSVWLWHSLVWRLSDVWRLTSVSLSRTSSLSREQRGLGRLELAHVTRTPLSRSKCQRLTCRGRDILWRPPAQLVKSTLVDCSCSNCFDGYALYRMAFYICFVKYLQPRHAVSHLLDNRSQSNAWQCISFAIMAR